MSYIVHSSVLTSGQVQRRDSSLDLDLRMRRLGPRVPEPYPLVEMTAHDGRADGLGRDQVVATGSGELGLDAYAHKCYRFTPIPFNKSPQYEVKIHFFSSFPTAITMEERD